MIEGVNFIGYSESRESETWLQAPDPQQNGTLPEQFAVTTEDELDRAVEKAGQAFQAYKHTSGRDKAAFLDAVAKEIRELDDTLVERVMQETGYPRPRVENEFNRTVNQLGLFAGLLREGSWVDARIDYGQPDRSPAPKPDLRNMRVALGPVAVFGASNFPLAFSTAGGDTASALAAGCPVVVKAHESHPGTNELVARAIMKAARDNGMPDGVFSSLNGGSDTGSSLVKHPGIRAVGFTGSFKAGKAIFDLATKREVPIPVYAEMGSTNPVFLLGEKLKKDAKDEAKKYAASVLLTNGQFCTKPGLFIGIKDEGLDRFAKALGEQLEAGEPVCMLNTGVAENYRSKRLNTFAQDGVQALVEPSGEQGTLADSAMATVQAATFLENPKLQDEVFGPFAMVIACEDQTQMLEVARQLEGQLTATLSGTEGELEKQSELVSVCREKAGRLIFNGVPTGVEVCPAMQHGGPFPATIDAKFTSVGTGAIHRFSRPVAWQDCPEALLPEELRTDNPLGIQRTEN